MEWFLVKYCQPDVIKLLAWNSMITFRKVILKAARNQRLKRDSSGFVFQGSTIFGTDRSKILLVPFLLIRILYVADCNK